jgi:hypothetical protein
MQTRYLDRHDDASHRPWPVSPYEHPLNQPPPIDWPTIARGLIFGSMMVAGVAALIIGVASYVNR